ncbi:MAG: molybdenum cofactor guanylyltransferase [Azoarcus sp.]|jgi:molybdopterin-guanine dinucleotide biosynthesis protein A|nr:molybdenum cofactor guanylyltransferase [Azoarcus sp.]
MIDDCTALILAGGASRRMGSDKAALRIGGQSLLQRMIDLTQALFPTVLLSVRQPREVQIAQVCDAQPGLGPLGGVCAGLRRAGTSWVFVVAVDMPYLKPETITRLAAMRGEHQAVIPVVDGHPQPLAAFYAVTVLPALESALAQEANCGLYAGLAGLDVLHTIEELPDFIDLDTPEDVAAARRFLAGHSQEHGVS